LKFNQEKFRPDAVLIGEKEKFEAFLRGFAAAPAV